MIPIRAAAGTIALGSILMWLYCVARIFADPYLIQWNDEFIAGIPITFLQISIASFIIFLASMFSYLVLAEIDGRM